MAQNMETLLKQRIAELEAQLASKKAGVISLKVTDGHVSETTGKPTSKGRISLYGLQRFPITLSRSQFLRLRDVLTSKCQVNYSGNPTTFDAFLSAASTLLIDKDE